MPKFVRLPVRRSEHAPGPYGLIYADPAWKYADRRKNGTKFGGGAENHYPCMTDQEMLDMFDFVDQLAARDCILAMWFTGARMEFANILRAGWGFHEATMGFVWEKRNSKSGTPVRGTGFYTAQDNEFILFGRRGRSGRPAVNLMPQTIRARRSEQHSEKPDEARRRLEILYPDRKRIELFARHARPGWDAWGNEVGKLGGLAQDVIEIGGRAIACGGPALAGRPVVVAGGQNIIMGTEGMLATLAPEDGAGNGKGH